MPNFVTRVFSKFDIFGSDVGLNFQKDSVFKTTFGGFISIGFVALIGIFFWSNYAIPLEPCTLEHWINLPSYGQNITQLYNTYNVQSFLCPKITQELLLGGNYNSEHFYHLRFQVSKCQDNYPSNSLWKPKCQTDDQINNYFSKNSNVRFSFYSNNFIINPLQNQNHISTFIEDSIFYSIQKSGAYQTADIFYTDHIVRTDKSILPFSDIQEENLLVYTNGNQRGQYVIGPTPTVYADFYIRKDQFSFEISRSFQKISEIVSYIGGFSQIFILITAIIANKVYDFKYVNNNHVKNKLKDEPNKLNGKQNNQEYINENNQSKSNNNQQIKSISSQIQINPSLTPLPIVNQNIQSKIELEEISKFKETKLEKINESPLSLTKRNKNKRITTREEVGLLPLDQIKNILTQRKTYIESQNKKKKGDNPERKRVIEKKTSIEPDEIDYFQRFPYQKDAIIELESEINQQRGKEQDNYQLQSYDSEIQNQNHNQIDQNKSKILSLMTNNQNNAKQIELKNVMNESISPESPDCLDYNFKKGLDTEYIQNQMQSLNNKNNINNSNQERFKQILSTKSNQRDQETSQFKIDLENYHIKYQENNKQYQCFENNKQLTQKETILNDKNQLTKNKQNLDYKKSFLPKSNEENSIIKEQLEIASIDQIQINSHQALNRNKNATLSGFENIGNLNSQQEIPDTKIFQSNNNILLQGLGFRDKKQFLNREFEFLLKKDSNIKMTYKFFLYKITCGKFFRTEQVLLLDKANKQMKKDLDIFMIINRLKELEKLKALFLDQNQQTLFNFFPKPVITVHAIEEHISRAEIAEQVKNKSDQTANKNIKVKGKQQKMLNISFKTAALVSKAASQFKKPLTNKINKFDNVIAYQKLYDAYDYIRQQKETEFNKKLIEQLGEEMNKIFEISNLIASKATNTKQKQASITYQNSDNNIAYLPQKSDRNLKMLTIPRQSIFKQPQSSMNLNDYLDSNTKRNYLLSDDITQIQTTERKI